MKTESADVYATFTFRCVICGATVQVIDSAKQPHICRVEIK